MSSASNLKIPLISVMVPAAVASGLMFFGGSPGGSSSVSRRKSAQPAVAEVDVQSSEPTPTAKSDPLSGFVREAMTRHKVGAPDAAAGGPKHHFDDFFERQWRSVGRSRSTQDSELARRLESAGLIGGPQYAGTCSNGLCTSNGAGCANDAACSPSPSPSPSPNAAPTATSVAFSGNAQVGVQVTGTYQYNDAESNPQGTSTFQWKQSATSNGTKTAISGATSQNYTPNANLASQYLFFCVTPVASSGTSPGSEACSAGTLVAAAANAAPTASSVAVQGNAMVGVQISGTYTYSDAEGNTEGTSTFQWKQSATSNGTLAAVSGATSQNYTPVANLASQYLFFCVTPVATTGTLTGTEVCSSGALVAPNLAPTASAVSIQGNAQVGVQISGLYTYSDAEGNPEGTSTFQWKQSATSNGTLAAVSGATSQNYTPVANLASQYLFFCVTPVATTGTLTGTEVCSAGGQVAAASAAPVATNVVVSGNAIVGAQLTGSYTYTDANSDLESGTSFRWMQASTSNGTKSAISGATGTTYTPNANVVGQYLFFCVTPGAATGLSPGAEACSPATAQVPPVPACGSAAGVASVFAPSQNLCAAGSVAGLITAGSPWSWTCSGAGGTPASCTAPNAATSTSTGNGRAIVSGNNWVVDTVNSRGFIPVTGNGSPPTNVTFPHGLLDLRLITGTLGSSATVTITYPAALPAGTVYWKYGKELGNATPHWYQYPNAVIAGNTITLTLTDGGAGDDDLTQNNVIVDPGGPGVPGGTDIEGIPTLAEWGRLLLTGLIGLLGAWQLRRRKLGLSRRVG